MALLTKGDKDNAFDILKSIASDKSYLPGDYKDAPAALPDSSLQILLDVCERLQVKSVFEFGSGRSTKALLSKGYSVTSLEDSAHWLNETCKTLTQNEKQKHHSFVQTLSTVFLGLFPVLGWKPDKRLTELINSSDVILIDSPYYTPFREYCLWMALRHNSTGIIILDDTRIPTLTKFCNRIAKANSSLLHVRSEAGHGFDFFIKGEETDKLELGQSFSDVVKGWLRYFKGKKFYANLKNQ